jgi:hypothetical protein
MKTVRYLLALLFVSAMPLFSFVMPDAMATVPSVMLAESAKSAGDQSREVINTAKDELSPYATALSEDVLKLVQALAKKYESVADATKDFDFKELGELGKELDLLGKVLDIAKYVTLIGDVVKTLVLGDKEGFVDALDKLTHDAVVDAAKLAGGKLGEVAGAAGGTAVGGPLAPITAILGKVGGGMVGEWLAEKAMEYIYEKAIQGTVRKTAGDLFNKYHGIEDSGATPPGESPGDLLPGVTTPDEGGATGSGGGKKNKKPVSLNPIKTY